MRLLEKAADVQAILLIVGKRDDEVRNETAVMAAVVHLEPTNLDRMAERAHGEIPKCPPRVPYKAAIADPGAG